MEQQHIVDYTEKKTKEKITKGFTELPWYMPNEETMKEMLEAGADYEDVMAFGGLVR